MTDSRNGKGGFAEFAKREDGAVQRAAPLGPTQDVKAAPVAGAAATLSDTRSGATPGAESASAKPSLDVKAGQH
jgi:hypothetical protein